jgi:3-deoxy-D-manno-octulosonic-acid transferase
MHFLYTFGIHFYGFIIRIASLFNEKAALFVRGRKKVIESIPDLKNKEVIWFHCASLGEFDQGLPLK